LLTIWQMVIFATKLAFQKKSNSRLLSLSLTFSSAFAQGMEQQLTWNVKEPNSQDL